MSDHYATGSEAGEVQSVAILVDFDNIYSDVDLASLTDLLPHEINRLLALALNLAPTAPRVDIRFYGGWLDDGVLTNTASALQQALATRPTFPMRHPTVDDSVLRGSTELVTRLLSIPEVEWAHTRRTRGGLPRLRLAQTPLPAGCVGDVGTCPLRAIYKFTKERRKTCHAEGCSVTNDQAFKVIEQKMVDSLIACDLISSAYSRPTTALIVLSDDVDLVPAVAVASSVAIAPIQLVRPVNELERPYTSVLRSAGVGLEEWNAA